MEALPDARAMLVDFRIMVTRSAPDMAKWAQIRPGMLMISRQLAEPPSDVAELTIASRLPGRPARTAAQLAITESARINYN